LREGNKYSKGQHSRRSIKKQGGPLWESSGGGSNFQKGMGLGLAKGRGARVARFSEFPCPESAGKEEKRGMTSTVRDYDEGEGR